MHVAALIAAVHIGSACAETTLHATAQYTSDAVVHGLSQTAGRSAVQGGLQLSTGTGTFAGVWATPVIFDPERGREPEFDVYLGHEWQTSESLRTRLAVARYVYPRDTVLLDYDYTELALDAEFADRLSATLAWSPDYSRYSALGIARHRSAWSAELAARQPFGRRARVDLGLARRNLDDLYGRGYWSWSAGLGWDGTRWSMAVTRFDTSRAARDLFGDTFAGRRWAFTITWRR